VTPKAEKTEKTEVNYEKMLPKKREKDSLPVMNFDCEIKVKENYRFGFDKTDPDNIMLILDAEEEKIPLEKITLRMISCNQAQPSFYDGEKYVKDSTMEVASGDESYICVAIMEYEGCYTLGTMMLRRSLTQIAARVQKKNNEVMEKLNQANQIHLASEIYLFLPFRPSFRKITNKKGSYLRVTGVNFINPTKQEIASCEQAFLKFQDELESTMEAAKYWLEP
jgi:hypothetical protein